MPSESRLPTSPKDGPFLLAALLCEKVLLEPDGVASAIRIVDQLTIQRVPDEALLKGAVVVPPVMHLSLLVILKSGNAPGTYRMQIRGRAPSGTTLDFPPREVELSKPYHGGVTHALQLDLGLREAGLYQFDVLIDDEFVSSVPLQVEFESLSPPT